MVQLTFEQAFELVKDRFDKRYVNGSRNRVNDGWVFTEWDKMIVVHDDGNIREL